MILSTAPFFAIAPFYEKTCVFKMHLYTVLIRLELKKISIKMWTFVNIWDSASFYENCIFITLAFIEKLSKLVDRWMCYKKNLARNQESHSFLWDVKEPSFLYK